MRTHVVLVTLLSVVAVLAPVPAAAQRFGFEQSFPVIDTTTLDVTTRRGKVEIEATTSATMQVLGTVTVRSAWDTPANAVALAQEVARRPPVQAAGDVVRLSVPSGGDEQRAVTVSYVVRVPAGVRVVVRSDSGAISVRGILAPVTVTTQSSAITARTVGHAEISSGSGAVRVSGATGAVKVLTSSSAIDADDLAGDVHARSGSGGVRVGLVGGGGVDVETSSSGIEVHGAVGPVTVRSNSGRVTVAGHPAAAWTIATGSSSIELTVPPSAAFDLRATSQSGSVRADGLAATSDSPRAVSGTIGGPGPIVRLDSRSGAIRVKAAGTS